MRRRFLLLTVLAATSCGDSGMPSDAYDRGPHDSGASAEASSLGPLATVTAPQDGDNHRWEFDPAQVRLQLFSDRQVLFLDATKGPVAVEIPIPSAAKGAGHVALRSMSDGAFRVSVAFGDNEFPAVSSGSTRRRWRELMVPLSRPLAVQSGDRMTLRLESSDLPVVMEAIRFMP